MMPVCEGCGNSYQKKFSFCPFCGRAKPEPVEAEVKISLKSERTIYDCPLCKNPASVQKVSAIVDSGTSHSDSRSYSYGSSNIYSKPVNKQVGYSHSTAVTSHSSTSRTVLARKLTPPSQPKEPQKESGFGAAIALATLFTSIFFCAQIGNQRSYGAGGFGFLGALILFWLVSCAVSAVLVSTNKSGEVEHEKKLQQYKKEVAQDKATYKKWLDLYYCHKHDVVFVAGSKSYAPSDQAWEACTEWASK
jgi:hypothetical protein